MPTDSPTWIARAVSSADRFAARPWLLLAFVFAVHVLARPYAGITHDAQLYAGQTLQRLDPTLLSDDLFFKYGSQDRFSLFSTIAAPMANALGLETAFFVLYLASDLLFLAALIRFLRTLLPDPRVFVPAVLLAIALPISYGGQACFHVHEPFLTPRLPAAALALEAITCALTGRWGRSFVMICASGLLHPLMAAPAAAVVVLAAVWTHLGWRGALLTCAMPALGLAAVLLFGFGTRLFGDFDAEWRAWVMQATSAHFPALWTTTDWAQIAFATAAIAAFVCSERDPAKRRVTAVIGIVGWAGLLASVIFSNLAYALPMQVQPYRALWMLMLLKAPLFWAIAVRCAEWSPAWIRWLSPVAIASFTIQGVLPLEWIVPFLLWPVALRWTPGKPADGLSLSLVISGGFFALLPTAFLVSNVSDLLRDYDFRAWYGLFATTACGLPLLLLLMQFRLPAGAWASAGLAMSLAWLAIPQTNWYQERLTPDGASARFVREYLGEHATSRPLAIYSDANRLHRVWLDCRSQSWFDTWQTSGFVFARATAAEGKRRAEIIAPLAMPALRRQRDRMTPAFQRDVCLLMARDFDSPPPTADDLCRICRDEAIDFLVLSTEFSGLADATDGRVWIYDARKLRGPHPELQAALP